MKLFLLALFALFSTQIFSQDSLKLHSIDSVIADGEKQVARIISDKILRSRIIVMHGLPDTVLILYKYSLDADLIEYSKIWIGQRDTGQITSYFFHKDDMIKVVTRTPFDSYVQFAYFDKNRLLYSKDSEGKENPNVKSYLNNYKKILRNAKLILRNSY